MPNTTTTISWDLPPKDGEALQESWPRHLPHSPSFKIMEDRDENKIPRCVVFHANSIEGVTMVRVLSEKGLRVVAVVRVFAGRKVKELIQLKRVTVRVADLNDRRSLTKAAMGCTKAFLVTNYWSKFENHLEENMAMNVLEAAANAGAKTFVKATFEDTLQSQRRGQPSQLEIDDRGRIANQFTGMTNIDRRAKELGLSLSHMFTSFLDVAGDPKTLVLIRGPKGRVLQKMCYKNQPSESMKDTESVCSSKCLSVESLVRPCQVNAD